MTITFSDIQSGIVRSFNEQVEGLLSIREKSPQEIGSFLYHYFAPEPLNPMFKEGGIFYGLNEDLTYTAMIMVLLFFIDVLIVKPFIMPKGRYFFLHAVANAIVVITCLPDIYRALTVHPYNTLNGPAFTGTLIGNSATVALHVYHMVAFKLTYEDWSHHLQFIPMCAFAPALKHKIGCMVALSNFFLSGLAGGLEYVFLLLVMHGKMKKSTEKSYFAWLNVWVRGPGAVWAAVLGYFGWREGVLAQGSMHPAIAWLFGFFHIYNGMYFCMIAVESQARFEYKIKYGLTDENGKPLVPSKVEKKDDNSAKLIDDKNTNGLNRTTSPMSPSDNNNQGVFTSRPQQQNKNNKKK